MGTENQIKGSIVLEDGFRMEGICFGAQKPASGEVVFNTGMVGYVETLTDPSYRGQILVMTYPLVGNYGVPEKCSPESFESGRIQVRGLIVSESYDDYSHHSAIKSLGQWLEEENVPGLKGIDTRILTLRLREKGTMLGRIDIHEPCGMDRKMDHRFFDPNSTNIVKEVTSQECSLSGSGSKRVVLVDCGCKESIMRSLLMRNVEIQKVPYDYDYTAGDFDGIVVSNGPGNPEFCGPAIAILKKAFSLGKPVLGICLGMQILALASAGRTYKLKYGHRSQNQPCLLEGSKRCFLTSQNHGFAVREHELPKDWLIWYRNANDLTVEGIRHKNLPFMGVQFHPEGHPGPEDTGDIFSEFVSLL
jgi:carbamoyl-phosphate synthase small subunit